MISTLLRKVQLNKFLNRTKCVQNSDPHHIIRRHLIVRKKFYNSVHISQNNGLFEICLDKRKLKTPLGKVLQIPNEALAVGIATEWNSQKDVLRIQEMHLTGLCSTAIDNPMKLNRESLAASIMEFLDTDTICYRQPEPEELKELQCKQWDPILNWIQNHYEIQLSSSINIEGPNIPLQTKEVLKRHLLSYNFPALIGFQYAVEAVKSLVLTLAAVDRHLLIDEAVQLSRLETEFQTKRWGSVDWAHDVDHMNINARFAAAILFVHLNSEQSILLKKCK